MSNENKSDPKPAKDVKCALNKKLYSATIRLSVSLKEPDEKSCSVFDYISLIAEEKRTRRQEREKNPLNGTIEENKEADEEVKKLALHFEEKYGGGNTKKKKKKKAPTFYNYSELAAGYDESDPFIDNSEAFDEALPDEMETEHGGYYVNCGQLEFKKVEIADDNSDDDIRVIKRKSCVLKSDDSDSNDDSSKSELDKSESMDDEPESTNKKLPEDTIHRGSDSAKSSINDAPKLLDKMKSETSKENVPNNVPTVNGEVIKKRKKYKKRQLLEDVPEDDSFKPKKKAITVKSLLEEKRIVENGDNCGAVKPNDRNSYSDAIESVVKAARDQSEDSRDSTSSSYDTKSIDSRTSYDTEKDSHFDEMEVESMAASSFTNIPKEQIKLPDNLPADVLDLITQLKNSAQNSELGVRTFFNPSINSKLLSLETKVRPLTSNLRHALYGYLSNFLPCSKDTLMKRAKKLLIEEEEKHMVEPFKKLKISIDKVMPGLLTSYTVACQQASDEKTGDLSKNGEKNTKLPHKKFIWTDETRNHLRDLVACRLKCFHMLKPRKESPDDYVKKFLETKVKPLWPQGWMETSILWKESHSNNAVPKVKKTPTASQNITNTKKPHTTVPSSISSSVVATSISTTNYNNYLSNSIALQSLAMQYSQSEMGYPITSSPNIPYRPDLNNLLTANAFSSPSSNLPLSVEFLSRIALANNQYASNPLAFSKTSPPKKQSPSPGYTSQRSTTPLSVTPQLVNSFKEAKKVEKKSNENFMSKYNEIFNTNKNKKEHHMLNHISQYNKHYSHKTEKRKSGNLERKEGATSNSKSCVTSHNAAVSSTPSTSHKGAAPVASKSSLGEVLDLSPNKPTKPEIKLETVPQNSIEHPKTESIISSTAKDHNYWAAVKKEDLMDIREESAPDKSPVLPILQRLVVTAESGMSITPKPTHISRKQRILQESAKSAAIEIMKTPEHRSSSQETSKSTQSLVKLKESTYVNESLTNNFISKEEETLSNIEEKKIASAREDKQLIEETATATDILSQIINETLQDNSTPLQSQFTNSLFDNNRLKPDVKKEDVESQLSDYLEKTHQPPKESLTPLPDKSPCSLSTERKTPSCDRAEIEAAEVIKDLLVLNQIGGHNPIRRMDYTDSRYIENRHLNSDLHYSNGSMLSQSSPHTSSSKMSSIPRMSLTGFQDKFLQHITKSDHETAFTNNSVSQENCFSTDFLLDSNKSFSHVSTPSVKPGNTSLYNYHQSVIMPPPSVKWHIPESKS